MQLKLYQERVLREVKRFLDLLAAKQVEGNPYPSLAAWDGARAALNLTAQYQRRQNGLGQDLPTFCIKVPTGGGKTLLATQILGQIHQTILKSRGGTGLVLWVVPSDQIYKDTLKALRDRRHFYRESLEHALSHRLEVWQKTDIMNLTPAQLGNNLNILLLKLPSTNRQDKEQLKFFRDSGGNIVQHFPAEDEPDQHRLLKQRFPNLEMLEDDAAGGRHLVKTSLGNLVRVCEPAVILDEGHKATSTLARQTVEGFNPAIVVELSATPAAGTNILARVSGRELLDEQMIKLPMNVASSNLKSWKDCVTQARDQRQELAEKAKKHYRETGRIIRPIVLVQVERTGKAQEDAGLVHSEHVKKYLIEGLSVPESAIAIKSAEQDDLEKLEMDLMDEGCPVEWIITKGALQEGWDCPFAYILVSLNNTASAQSMTQLVGRVLRQPDVTRTSFPELNESYVWCLRKKAADITKEVKKALEKEGYEGDAASVVDRTGEAERGRSYRPASIQERFRRQFQLFEGKIYLPHFCVQNGREGPERLDYFRHLLRQVDVEKFDYAAVDWDLAEDLRQARDIYYRITLEQDLERVGERAGDSLETDAQVMAWLTANLDFAYYSQKELRYLVREVVQRLCQVNDALVGKLPLVKFAIRERLAGFIERETDRLTEAAFKRLFDSKKLCFYLQCVACRFEIPPQIEVRATRQLCHDNGDLVQRSLFDFTPNDLNEYERSIALYLDKHPQVLWWYRNLVGPEHFSIQGYRRHLIYPDFVVQRARKSKPDAWVLVLEGKGAHLQGNQDTTYKRSVAGYFEKIGQKVPWQKLAEEFGDHQFRFQVLDEGTYGDRDWHDELRHILLDGAEASSG